MTAIERLIQTAKYEIGYLEKKSNSQLDNKLANAGRNNYTKYARDMDNLGFYNSQKNGYSWCDVFADWCFVQTFGTELALKMTCQPMGGYGAGCTMSAQYYKDAGRFYKNNPIPGDQIFFKNSSGAIGHTGIVTAVDKNRVYTVEGNTSSDAGVVDNGGSVNAKSYLLSYDKIAGYGRPDYSLVVEEDDEDMTQEKFNEMMNNYLLSLQDNDCGPWSESGRKFCIENGLIAGNGTTINGEPNYMWHSNMTREQFAVVLERFAKLMGKA